MTTKLTEMSLEELWQLFPIILTEPNPEWETWYEEEAELLKVMLPGDVRIADSHSENIVAKNPGDGNITNVSPAIKSFDIIINHIGSTAIQGIWAKPVIDILVEFDDENSMSEAALILENNGYLCMNRNNGRISINKGYTENGFAERVFHIHLRIKGDNAEIAFRDRLNEDAALAKEYEKMKLSLWKKYEHDRDGYTAAKSEFVAGVLGRG